MKSISKNIILSSGDEAASGSYEERPYSIDGTYELSATFGSSSCGEDVVDELKDIENQTFTVDILPDPQDENKAEVVFLNCTGDCVYQGEVDKNTVTIYDSDEDVSDGCTSTADGELSITINGDFVSGYMYIDVFFEGSCYPLEECEAYFDINGIRVSQSRVEMKSIKAMRDNLSLKMTCIGCEESQTKKSPFFGFLYNHNRHIK